MQSLTYKQSIATIQHDEEHEGNLYQGQNEYLQTRNDSQETLEKDTLGSSFKLATQLVNEDLHSKKKPKEDVKAPFKSKPAQDKSESSR